MAKKRDKEYWRRRAARREREAYTRGEALTEKLFREYEAAARDIRRQISDWYTRYATENGLTYDQAVRLMSRPEMQTWKADLGAYVERIAAETDPKIKARLTAELDALSYNSRISRLDALLGEIDATLGDLYQRGVHEMRDGLCLEFEASYYRKVYDIQARVGYINEFAKIGLPLIEEIVSYPWSGMDFSDRLWRNKQALIYNLRETLTQGLIRGDSVAAMSKSMADHMGKSYRTAETLIRTENNRVHNEADTRAYRAAGVKEYEYMATNDVRTCDECAALDGKHYPLDEAKVGVNFPPLHPNDRCTTVEYDPDEALDWYNSGEPMPEGMTYAEWAEFQDIEHGQGYLKRAKKQERNRAADEKQYARYAELLGKDMPGLDDFRRIKYDDSDGYRLLKLDYTRRSRLKQEPEFALPNLDNIEARAEKFTGYIFNPENLEGFIKGQNFERVLGYKADNWQALQRGILSSAAKYPATFRRASIFGEQYEQQIVLRGENGKMANVVVGWIAKDGKTTMTTAYIKGARNR